MLRSECSYEDVTVDYEILDMFDKLDLMWDRDVGDYFGSTHPRVIHSLMGFRTETAEMLDAYKKTWFYHKPLDRVNVLEEIGDVLWYVEVLEDEVGMAFYGTRDLLDQFAKMYDSNLEDCRNMVINKLKIRYPDKFTNQDAETRDLTAERESLENGV